MLGLLVFVISLGLCTNLYRIPNHSTQIIDIVHNNCPEIKIPYISDILVAIQVCAMLYWQMSHWYDMITIMGITQIMKVLCSASTVLPPLKAYDSKYRFGGLNGSGKDYIFSGHAAYAALSSIYLYSIIPLGWLVGYNIVTQFLIIATRNHYTVDVLLAWLIVPLVYGNIA